MFRRSCFNSYRIWFVIKSIIIVFVSVFLQYSDYSFAANLTVFCGSTNKNESYFLTSPLPLLQSKCFNNSRPTMIYAFGFTSSGSDNCTQAILKSFLSCGIYNVIMVDWEKEVAAITKPINFLSYPGAVINARKVGEQLADALNMMSNSSLTNITLDLNTTRGVGHSLGARMLGYACHLLKKFLKIIFSLVGLDPAGPGFDGPDKSEYMSPTSALNVYAVHSSDFYGTTEEVGKADIWFNCNETHQPQCADKSILEIEMCDHYAACYFYALAVEESECLQKETRFLAKSSDSCDQFTEGNDIDGDNSTIYLGEPMDTSASGNYYLITEAEYPYGEGEDGI